MLTADTVTDEQIRDLQSEYSACDKGDTWWLCHLALQERGQSLPSGPNDARERLAEILNARASKAERAPTLTADTLTDEQIKNLWSTAPSEVSGALLMDALGQPYGPFMRQPTTEEARAARARCAEIINAREASKAVR